jgi:hypothetical protein
MGSVGVRAMASTCAADAGLKVLSSTVSGCVSLVDDIGREGNGGRCGVWTGVGEWLLGNCEVGVGATGRGVVGMALSIAAATESIS